MSKTKRKQLNGHVIPQQKKKELNFTIDSKSPTPTHIHKHKQKHFDASYENAEFDTILRTWRANKFKMHIIVVKNPILTK